MWGAKAEQGVSHRKGQPDSETSQRGSRSRIHSAKPKPREIQRDQVSSKPLSGRRGHTCFPGAQSQHGRGGAGPSATPTCSREKGPWASLREGEREQVQARCKSLPLSAKFHLSRNQPPGLPPRPTPRDSPITSRKVSSGSLAKQVSRSAHQGAHT